MNKDQRKKLKNIGKAAVKKSSFELQAKLAESNPVGFSDPNWGANYKQITIKEKEYRNNRRTIYPGSFIGTECILNPVDMEL